MEITLTLDTTEKAVALECLLKDAVMERLSSGKRVLGVVSDTPGMLQGQILNESRMIYAQISVLYNMAEQYAYGNEAQRNKAQEIFTYTNEVWKGWEEICAEYNYTTKGNII